MWAYCILAAIPDGDNVDLETQKRVFLAEKVIPILSGRRWFFRRVPIERFGWLTEYCIAVYVELLLSDNLECLRQVLQYELCDQCEVSNTSGHAVIQVREWDGCFGRDYGGPAAQEAMREFVVEAAPVALIEKRDPIDIAAKHSAKQIASPRNIAHWYIHLRDGDIIQDEEAERIIEERVNSQRKSAKEL